jgi:hypothetical protein
LATKTVSFSQSAFCPAWQDTIPESRLGSRKSTLRLRWELRRTQLQRDHATLGCVVNTVKNLKTDDLFSGRPRVVNSFFWYGLEKLSRPKIQFLVLNSRMSLAVRNTDVRPSTRPICTTKCQIIEGLIWIWVTARKGLELFPLAARRRGASPDHAPTPCPDGFDGRSQLPAGCAHCGKQGAASKSPTAEPPARGRRGRPTRTRARLRRPRHNSIPDSCRSRRSGSAMWSSALRPGQAPRYRMCRPRRPRL